MSTTAAQQQAGGTGQHQLRRNTRLGAFDLLNYALLIALAITMLYPLWHVLIASLVDKAEYYATTVFFYPKAPTFENYEYLFAETSTLRYVLNTGFVTLVGTFFSLLLQSMMAYGLSRKFPGVITIVFLVTATMFLYPGLIPNYINFKNLGLINTRMVLILIPMMQPFYLLIFRSNFMNFPEELIDAARVDGYNHFAIFFTIVIPLSKPILAAIGLFVAVNYWNMLLPSIFFISQQEKKMIQDYLLQLLSYNQLSVSSAAVAMEEQETTTETLRMAAIITGVLPILMVYPFLQKYFVKGALLGALKG
jgi:ABC-type glycerol-3-phosphate transport system permease component